MNPLLFLLKPGFYDGPGNPYYCPYCMMFEGVLKVYSQLTHQLELRYVDFKKPRQEIVDLIGEENQSCPVIVFDQSYASLLPFKANRYGDRLFLNEPEEIGLFLSRVFQLPRPHF